MTPCQCGQSPNITDVLKARTSRRTDFESDTALYVNTLSSHNTTVYTTGLFFEHGHGFFQVNEGQLTLLNFLKEASTRQKLIAFLFLVDLFRLDLFTSST